MNNTNPTQSEKNTDSSHSDYQDCEETNIPLQKPSEQKPICDSIENSSEKSN